MSRYLARSREGGVQTYVCPAKVAYIRARTRVKLSVRMMFGNLLILLLVNFSAGFHIKDGETYPGFTVFDDKQGNYVRVKGKFFINLHCIGRSDHLQFQAFA